MTVRFFQRWSLTTISHLLTTRLIPSLLGCLSLLAIVLLSPKPALQQELLGSVVSPHSYYLIEGGIWAAAIFAFLLAFYQRNNLFLLIGAWTLCNLRLGGMLLNQDAFWLQLYIPPSLLAYVNQLVTGMYFLLSQQLLQRALRIPTNYKINRYLNILALLVFASACLPYSQPFSALFHLALPIGLGAAVFLSLRHLLIHREQLLLWQVVSLSTLLCGLAVYLLSWSSIDHPFLSNFSAFIFFILCQAISALWFLEFICTKNSQHQELHTTLHRHPFPFLRVDFQGRILYSNQKFKHLSHELIQGQAQWWTDIFPEQNWKFLAKSTQNGEPVETSTVLSAPNQFYRPQFKLFVKITPACALVSLLPSSGSSTQSTTSKGGSTHNVLNQHGLEKALQYTLAHLDNHQPCFLAYLEVNQISQVSRSHGHAASEALLQSISERLHVLLENKYAFGRIGNDDFVFIMSHTSPEAARALAQDITQSLNTELIKTPGRDYKLDVHLGLIELNPDMDEQTALRIVQSASGTARRQKKEFVLYEHDSLELQYHAEELTLFQHLENGSTQGLFIEMQPLMSLANPVASLNVEVLLRIRRGNGELIPTYNFIAAAEENGTIATIDKWVFATTLEWLDKHQDQLHTLNLVTINLSGSSLNSDKFIADLFVILERYRPLLNRLCVEITEGVALQDLGRTRSFMARLQSKGVRIALDDFGAGYTSFNYLRELPADLIKIDGALIRDMRQKESNVAIVRTIVELAHNLGMSCVAEWVEDAETLALLNDMRVHYVQGYAISPSVSSNAILNCHSILDLIESQSTHDFINQTYPSTRTTLL